MRAPASELESLLTPNTAPEFFSRYWERAPLVVSRHEPERYASLLGASDLDFIISSAFSLQKSAVEVVGNAEVSRFLIKDEAEHVGELYEAYGRGATIRVNRVERYWKPLRELCRGLEQTFKFPVRANLYCTPAGSPPSKLHYDTHDVLVLQIRGRKSWRIFEPLVRLPLADVPPLPFEERTGLLKYARGGPKKGRANISEDECGAPLLKFTLEAGGLLYMPRGFVHHAWAEDVASIHVTVGLHVLRWLDLLAVALAQVSNRDERFRRALPNGLGDEREKDASELLAALIETYAQQASLREAIEEIAGSFVQSSQAIGDGTLAGAEDSAGVHSDTLLEHRPGLLCRFARQGGGAGLVAAHNTVWMPDVFAEALRFIADTRHFSVRDIPGSMTENSKLGLARRLVRDGFLRIAGVEKRTSEQAGIHAAE